MKPLVDKLWQCLPFEQASLLQCECLSEIETMNVRFHWETKIWTCELSSLTFVSLLERELGKMCQPVTFVSWMDPL